MKTIITFAFLVILLASGAANATVIFSNPYSSSSTNALSSFWYNSFGPYHQSFADYDWGGSGSITDFHWWGSYGGATNNLTGFTFEIWSNDESTGKPMTKVYDQFLSGNAGETYFETNASIGDIYQYSLNLDTPFTLGAGKYWFSILAHNYGENWFWAQSSGVSGSPDWQHQSMQQDPSYWANVNGGDLAFELSGPDGNVVPEPASLTLICLGLLAGELVIRFRN